MGLYLLQPQSDTPDRALETHRRAAVNITLLMINLVHNRMQSFITEKKNRFNKISFHCILLITILEFIYYQHLIECIDLS